ncbi:MAG: ABC transporter ATP-binding protein [Fidelibacterota bacterium]
MEASVTLKKVGKLVGGKTILAGLTFGIEKGSLVAIVGDNDAGKSTLLKVLAGVAPAEYGAVYIHGLDMVRRRRETQRQIGYVPHEVDFDPWLTIEQNIHFIGALYGVQSEQRNRRIERYSNHFQLYEYLPEKASGVSLGILKKAMIVRALVHDPSVLILDEPTAFMDAQSRRLTWDLLHQLKGEKTIIYVSQSLPEVEQANDRIIVLHEGRILLDGSLDRLLESTLEYHEFQIEFETLTEELFKELSDITTVVNPSRIGNAFHFYGRSRQVFFQVLNQASKAVMTDLSIHKLSLKDLMDSDFARKGLE